MPRAQKEPERCKAIAASTGKRCRQRAGDDGYCSRHKRPNGGPPIGNRNGEIHGIYTRGLSEEEKQLADGLDLLKIDAELLREKIRYTRLLRVLDQLEAIARSEPYQGPTEEDDAHYERLLRLYELRSEAVEVDGKIIQGWKEVSRVLRMPDLDALVDRVLARIESLTKLKLQLDERENLLDRIDDLRQQLEDIQRRGEDL